MIDNSATSAITERYKKLLGRPPEQHELEHLARVKEVLGISDNDALWLVIMCLESYHTRLDTIPRQHERQFDVWYTKKEKLLDQQIQEQLQANINTLSDHVLQLAKREQLGLFRCSKTSFLMIIGLTACSFFLAGLVTAYFIL